MLSSFHVPASYLYVSFREVYLDLLPIFLIEFFACLFVCFDIDLHEPLSRQAGRHSGKTSSPLTDTSVYGIRTSSNIL